MLKIKTVFQVALCLLAVQASHEQSCRTRDAEAAGRPCKRACRKDGSCRDAFRICVCDGLCGLSCSRRKQSCRTRNVTAAGRPCERACLRDGSCRNPDDRVCVCDGLCGLSCFRKKPCKAVDDVPGRNIHYGSDQPSGHGSILTVNCEQGYFLIGNKVSLCSAGTWSPAVGYCFSNVTFQLRMDIAPTSSVIKSSNGSFVVFTTTSEVTVTCKFHENHARLHEHSSLQKDGAVLWGFKRSTDNSIVGYTINHPTTADSGVYKCISDELSHSIRIVFEDPPQCPRPPINESVIATTGLVEAGRQSFNEGETLTFFCEDDRRHRKIDGRHQIQCKNGEWILAGTDDRITNNASTCITNVCRRPHINQNVIVHVGREDIPLGNRQSFTEEEIITSRCNDPRDQILIGPVRRRCSDGEWTETAPRCVDSQIRMGVDNTRLYDITSDGTFVVFPISGQVWIICEKTSGTPFDSFATITTNSSVQPNYSIVQNNDRLRRMEIYNPISANSGIYTCNVNASSRSINIRFEDIRCTELEPVSNDRWEHVKDNANRFTPTSYIFMERVTLHCNTGYRVSGTRDWRCNHQGRWSPPLAEDRMENIPTCTTIGCDRPDINLDVIVHVGEDDIPIGDTQFFTEGEIITSRCKDHRDQVLIGPIRRHCSGGVWTGTAPRCVDTEIRMDVFFTSLYEIVPDGTFVVSSLVNVLHVRCKKLSGTLLDDSVTVRKEGGVLPYGYFFRLSDRVRLLILIGSRPANSGTYTCNANGLRRSINVKFEDIRCTEPDPVPNGRWEHIKAIGNRFIPTSYIFTETVRVHCNAGYLLNGTRDSRCNYQGRWSPPLASCVAN